MPSTSPNSTQGSVARTASQGVRRRSARLLALVVSALLLVGIAALYLVQWFPMYAPTSIAQQRDALAPAHRALLEHLNAERLCQSARLLWPHRSCATEDPPPAGLDEVAAQLRALAALEPHADGFDASGGAPFAVARCLFSISSEVEAVLVERVYGDDAKPPRPLNAGLADRDCEGVALPELPEPVAAPDFTRACAHAFDAERRVEPRGLSHCLRTLAHARLAEAGVGPPLRRPNMIVILVDDQRFDTIDATHGPQPDAELPAMPNTHGRLAGEGITFTQAIVTTPICAPSRGSFFTGRFAHRHGMLANGGRFGVTAFDDTDTWATRLQGAGYRTGFLGKYANAFTELWDPESQSPVTPPGWDEFRTFNHPHSVPQTGFEMIENGEIVSYDGESQPYSTDVLAKHALRFIEQSVETHPDTPFALWISTTTPHFPNAPAERHLGAFNDYRTVMLPSTFEADVSDKPPWIQSRALPRPLDLIAHQDFRRRQLEMQLSTDEMIATLLDRLDALGVGDDTIVVYTSDNGQAWGDHRWDGKGCPWEACLRVPMLLRYPRLVPGARSIDGLAANVDLVPTLLGLAGAEPPEDTDGVDLGGVIRGIAPSPQREVLFEAYSTGHLNYAGIRADGIKYFVYRNGDAVLHDLGADPFELENFADDPAYATQVEALRARLLDLWPGFAAVRHP